jgi:uncharacterized protein YchJ
LRSAAWCSFSACCSSLLQARKQARRPQQRLRAVRVKGWQLDVRVYFATQHPSKKLLAQAQAELDQLLLPHRG